jgi:hypothetical protein
LKVLTTILRQVPCRSVKVVAFNLDTQKEVYSENLLDVAGYTELARALRRVNTSVVSYPSLRSAARQDFLLAMVQKETTTTEPPNAVVFIGSAAHFADKPPTWKAEPVDRKLPPFFYFERFAHSSLGKRRSPSPRMKDQEPRTQSVLARLVVQVHSGPPSISQLRTAGFSSFDDCVRFCATPTLTVPGACCVDLLLPAT